MSFVFKGLIVGAYCSMKNGRRIVKRGNGLASIKKEKALLWERLAMLQIKPRAVQYEGPVVLVADFYYDNVRSDLDENLLKDMLQLKRRKKDGSRPPCLGIIKDDNQIKKHVTTWHLDKLNPRVEFKLVDLETFNEEHNG